MLPQNQIYLPVIENIQKQTILITHHVGVLMHRSVNNLDVLCLKNWKKTRKEKNRKGKYQNCVG